MIRNALAGRELPICGERKQVRDWLYVVDNCQAIDLVLQKARRARYTTSVEDARRRTFRLLDRSAVSLPQN
jgi:dTDP-D-glucose 4,6-dehydratase